MRSPKLFTSVLRVDGEAGSLRVLSPFQPHVFHRLTIRKPGVTVRERVPGENSYTLQLRAFVKAIRRGTKFSTDPTDGIGNMRVIDAIYEKAGLKKRGM
jgi:predicted dehydrogenase